MGSGAADIADVVPYVNDRLPDVKPPRQLDSPEQARFRLDSITASLKSAARRKPLVLVLDDLHWADYPSLLLLEFVARELTNARVMVIGTYRDVALSRQHPLSQTLGELTRERLFQRVLLRGLDSEDVRRGLTRKGSRHYETIVFVAIWRGDSNSGAAQSVQTITRLAEIGPPGVSAR